MLRIPRPDRLRTSLAVLCGLLLAAVASCVAAPVGLADAGAGDINVWVAHDAPAGEWKSVAYGNGVFVAVGQFGDVGAMISGDGVHWYPSRGLLRADWRSITFGNGMFVAVGPLSGLSPATSTDGITWTTSGSYAMNAVAHGGGRFVVVGGALGTSWSSVDAAEWQPHHSISTSMFTSVAYGNGTFVAVASYADDSGVATSSEGMNWTTQNAGLTCCWASVAFGDGHFVALPSGAGHVMTSTDGITWTASATDPPAAWRGITYGNGEFLAVSWANDDTIVPYSIHTSVDGLTWTSDPTSLKGDWAAVAYGEGTSVAVAASGAARVMTLRSVLSPPPIDLDELLRELPPAGSGTDSTLALAFALVVAGWFLVQCANRAKATAARAVQPTVRTQLVRTSRRASDSSKP